MDVMISTHVNNRIFSRLSEMLHLGKRESDAFSEADMYTDIGLKFRENFLVDVCRQIEPGCVVDLGCGDGGHAILLTEYAQTVIAVDRDRTAIRSLNRRMAAKNVVSVCQDILSLLHPLEIDNKEHFLRRIKPDLVCGTALIHHLCIGDGLSMDQLAFLFHSMADDVVIEFVPPEDAKVGDLIRNGGQMRPDYSLKHCVSAFEKYYSSHLTFTVPDSDRRLIRFIRSTGA